MDTLTNIFTKLQDLLPQNLSLDSFQATTNKRSLIIIGISIPATALLFTVSYKTLFGLPDPPKELPKFTGYHHENIAAPSLSGITLKFFRHLLELPLIGNLVGSILYKLNKYYIVHHFAYNLPQVPTHLPYKYLDQSQISFHQTCRDQADYSTFLQSFELINKLIGDVSDNSNSNTSTSNTGQLTTIEAIYNSYKSGTNTPITIIKQAIDNKNRLSHLRIFTQFNEEDIMNQAKESAQRWKEGKQLSILDGIPIAVKDQFNVKGYYSTRGTLFKKRDGIIDNYQDERLIVKRIRNLGGIVFGMVNMHEVGIQPNGYNAYYGACKNPYSVKCKHNTGGSSSGSAAAVASQLVPLALGADAGGSIRTPAAMCGVYGLKCSYGRVPWAPGKRTGVWSHLHDGCLGNTLKDEIIGYMALSGAITQDEYNSYPFGPNSWPRSIQEDRTVPPPHLFNINKISNNNDLSDLTIGIYPDWNNDSQQEVSNQMNNIISTLKSQYNIKIKEITIPYLHILEKSHAVSTLSEWLTTDLRVVNNSEYLDSTQLMLSFAQQYKSRDFIAAQIVRTWILDYLDNQVFGGDNKIDVLLHPGCAIVADKYYLGTFDNNDFIDIFDAGVMSNLMKFAHFGNFTGIPSLSVPIGYTNIDGSGNILNDGSKLPISMQIVSNHWNEHIVLRVANAVEKIVKRELPPDENRASYKL